MKSPAADPTPRVSASPIKLRTADGMLLSGTWFLPELARCHAAVVVACGGGIPAHMYERLSRLLAERGMAVLTFDYRGIGRSRIGGLRKFEAGIEHWGVLDFGAALAAAVARFPDQTLAVVAHSIGTLLIGAAPDSKRIDRLVLLAPHTGYWRDYGERWRSLLFFVWHLFMPFVTKIVGFFPGRAFGLGEDLPRGFAMDWAGRRQPELLVSANDQMRFEKILAGYPEIRCPTLAISVTDDAFAPPAAARRLLASYPGISADYLTVSPNELGHSRLGHFGFLRAPGRKYFSELISAWILQFPIFGPRVNEGFLDGKPSPLTTDGARTGSATH